MHGLFVFKAAVLRKINKADKLTILGKEESRCQIS